MMNLNHTLESLAKRARESKPPEVDVVDRVMLALDASPAESAGPDPFFWVAGASAVAAVLAVVLSASAWGMLTDPIVPAVLEVMGAIG